MDVHTRLLVDDVPACYHFYRDMVGLEAGFGDAESGYIDFRVGENTYFSLFQRSEMEAAVGARPGSGSGRDEFVLVIGVDDLEAAVERLRTGGVGLVTPIADRPAWGIRTAHVRDPAGTLIELNVPFVAGARSDEQRAEEHGVQGDAG